MQMNVNTSGINAVANALVAAVGKNMESIARDALAKAGAPQNFVQSGQVKIEDGLNVEAEVGPCKLDGQDAWGVTRIVITPTYNGKTVTVPAPAPATPAVDPNKAKIADLVAQIAKLIG